MSPKYASTPLGQAMGANKSGTKRRKRVLLLLAGLSPIPLVGFVLAANVNINGGDGTNDVVEFGQGSASATACDTTMTTTLNTTYNGTSFMLTTIVLSNVDTTSSGCLNKAITVSPANASSALASAVVTPTATPGSASGTFTLNPSPSVTASAITKILIQTQ
jgi:hypothetical protein